jgi:hypothetical protein
VAHGRLIFRQTVSLSRGAAHAEPTEFIRIDSEMTGLVRTDVIIEMATITDSDLNILAEGLVIAAAMRCLPVWMSGIPAPTVAAV